MHEYSAFLKIFIIAAMIPIALIAQQMFMAYTRNEYWLRLDKSKKHATLGMGSIASCITGLWLYDIIDSPTRFMFWMFIAALVGGEGVQLIVAGTLFRLSKRLGIISEKEKVG